MSFLEQLWQSILQPGTNQALRRATHASFVALVPVLVGLLYVTGSLHFLAMLVLALSLWAAITWFIAETNKQPIVVEASTGEEPKIKAASDSSEPVSNTKAEHKAEHKAEPKAEPRPKPKRKSKLESKPADTAAAAAASAAASAAAVAPGSSTIDADKPARAPVRRARRKV